MRFLVIIIIFTSFSLLASTVELPRGGKISVDSTNWTVLENKVTPELKSLIIFNKNDEKLRGFILDGSIKTLGACSKKTNKKWLSCEKKQKVKNEVHHQIYLQRKVGKNTFQNYVVSFNYDATKDKEYSEKLSQLKVSLEMK